MTRLPRTETLLVLASAAGAAMLGASQFMNMFELIPPGGEALAAVDAADQHGYATLVLAAFSLVMLVLGIAVRDESISQIASFSVAACGVVALLIFLVGDLPDANNIGTLDDPNESFIDAEAKPVAGFWFELAGSLVLAACGIALATMGPDQLNIFNRRGGSAAKKQPAPRRGRAKDEAEEMAETKGAEKSGGFNWPSRKRGGSSKTGK